VTVRLWQWLRREPGDVADRVRVVYVGAHDRSGSTLLDRLLGTRDGSRSVGELRQFWGRGLLRNQLCGCGVPLRDCPFWGSVASTGFGGVEHIDAQSMLELQRSVERLRRFPRILAGSKAALGGDGRRFLQTLGRLYRAIAEVAGCDVIVDSSKDPVYGALLPLVEEIEPRFVHLVRDPRAVAFSEQRSRIRPEVHWTTNTMMQRGPARSALTWDLSTLMWRRIAARYGAATIRYEDLAENTTATLEDLYRRVGLEGGPFPSTEVSLATAHTVSGNPMRFSVGQVLVRADREWEHAMNVRDRNTVRRLTSPYLRAYGYPKHVGRSSLAAVESDPEGETWGG
jgi:hypothetical protein